MMPTPATQTAFGKLYWRGILTQSMSMSLGGELLRSLKDHESLIVNLDGVEFLDFSCLVLLCAIKRQATEKGKRLLFEGMGNPVVAAVVNRYYKINGNQICLAHCGHSCLFAPETSVVRAH